MDIYSKPPPYEGQFRGQGMISLTFDDARKDFARVAVPIMQRYDLLATTFAITGWTDGTYLPDWSAKSCADGPCSIAQLQHCHNQGFEIGAHGDQHDNTQADLNTCLAKLKQWEITRDGKVETFASPSNTVTPAILPTNRKWFMQAGLSCARSGNASGSSAVNVLNNMPYPPPQQYMLMCNIVNTTTTMADLLPVMMDAIQNKKWCIIQLHSILFNGDVGYGNDIWYWDVANFLQLCQWLAQVSPRDCLIVTMRDGWRYASGKS